MKSIAKLTLIISFLASPLLGGPGQSKQVSKPKTLTKTAAGLAAAKHAGETAAAGTALAQTMRKFLLPDVWNVVFEYIPTFDLAMVKTIPGNNDTAIYVAAMDENEILSGDVNGSIKLWDTKSGNIRTLHEHASDYSSVVMKIDNNHFIAGDTFHLKLWHKNNPQKPIREFDNINETGIRCIEIIDDQHFITSASASNMISYWNIKQTLPQRTLDYTHNSSRVWRLAKIDSEHFVSCSDASNFSVRLWHKNQKNVDPTRCFQTNELESHIAVLDNNHFVTCSKQGIIKLWNKNNSQAIREIDIKNAIHRNGLKTHCMVALDSNHFIVCVNFNFIVLYHKDHTDPIAILKVEPNVSCVAVIDCDHFVTGHYDGTLSLWELGRANKLKTILHAYKNK